MRIGMQTRSCTTGNWYAIHALESIREIQKPDLQHMNSSLIGVYEHIFLVPSYNNQIIHPHGSRTNAESPARKKRSSSLDAGNKQMKNLIIQKVIICDFL